ncbi:dimethyl sulfoxide reductase anchor subunit family protein [Actinomyces faecalis]|uniref:dimethyl sulfoxide reductase anchor subunit family protein n=1 Tax=Actinomyces faecalis TaxID=2722820 RepID=UPI001555F71D|nr:DmsC/YnfH family molybdoenzyme membrane anchor subunit [Actinomyces faecalis]
MNTAELPMILFTVLAQMSVGAFLTLGLIQADGLARRQPVTATDRVTRAALFAVGPLLVLGFFAAFFHLGDPFHAVNTLRHLGSSWLSREILFGVLYGGLGLVYTVTEWLGKGSRTLRQALAVLTALAGVALLVSMICVYYSVPTIPAWHTPATWALFLGSAFLTGPLAVGVALLLAWTQQRKREDDGTANLWARTLGTLQVTSEEKLDETSSGLIARAIQQVAVLASVAGVVLLVTYPFYLLHLSSSGDAASAHVLSSLTHSPLLAVRLVLLAVVVILVRFVAYRRAKAPEHPSTALVWTIVVAYVLAVVTEMAGRVIHYEGLYHVGLNTLQSGLGG